MDKYNQQPPTEKAAALIPHPAVSKLARQQQNLNATNLPYGFETEDDFDQQGNVVEYLRILQRKKKTILLAALAGLTVGFLIGIPMSPTFRARTSVEVLSLNQDFMNIKQASPTTTSNGDSYDTSEEQTQAKLLESTELLRRVSAKLDPASEGRTRSTPQAKAGWRSWLHLPEPAQLSARQAKVIQAANSLKIRAIGRTRVLEATVSSKDPKLAADFANTLIEEFIQMNLEARYESTHRTSEWLKREIDDARARLQKSEDALQSYARESGLIFTDENTNVATEKLQQFQQQLSAATADRIAKESRFKLSKSSPPDSLADVLGDKNLQDETAKLNELHRQVAALSAVFNPGYDKLQQAQAELAVGEAAFNHDRTEVLQRIENDYEQAVNNEKLLAAAYEKQTSEVTGQGEKGIQYNILKREVDSNRQLYDTMLQQTKEAAIASAMRASNVRVVDTAQVPTSPISPDFKLNSALGLISGLLLSMLTVVIRERADRTLQQPGDIKLRIDLPELGTIPAANADLGMQYYRRSESRVTAEPRRAVGTQSVELITLQQKPSFVAEAFRSSLASILFVGDTGSRTRTIVFTSAGAGDGKTTVVSNLAIATAEIRRKVLVIDADLRRPRMHMVFEVSNDRGLSDLLSEELTDQALSSVVQESAIPGLHVLVAGPPTEAAAHLLYSPNFASILAKAQDEYDMILIDTPPVLQITDARIAGRLADAVILVARANVTTRDALLAVKDRFAEDRTPVMGTILNDWDPKKSHQGYYGAYRSSYYKSYSYAAD